MTREEAITIIDNLHLIGCGRNQHENDLKINIAIDMAIEALSAEVGQRGEWERVSADKYVQHAYHFYRCSKCGYDHIGKTNFCPNCGAKMGGKE